MRSHDEYASMFVWREVTKEMGRKGEIVGHMQDGESFQYPAYLPEVEYCRVVLRSLGGSVVRYVRASIYLQGGTVGKSAVRMAMGRNSVDLDSDHKDPPREAIDG